jgi:hypothetical protein
MSKMKVYCPENYIFDILNVFINNIKIELPMKNSKCPKCENPNFEIREIKILHSGENHPIYFI